MPSSVVACFSYDKIRSVLKVFFTSGAIYEYENVPENIFSAMRSSLSKGVFLNTMIKGRFQYKKLS